MVSVTTISFLFSVLHDYTGEFATNRCTQPASQSPMIRKLQSGKYRLYSRKKNPKTGHRQNLGTFSTRAAAEKHEREVQYFKKG
jgi:hypothetical protein